MVPVQAFENNQGSSHKHKNKTKKYPYKVLKDDLNYVCPKDSIIMRFLNSLFSTTNLNGGLTKYMSVFSL